MKKLSRNYWFSLIVLISSVSIAKADVEISPVLTSGQNSCNNYVTVRFEATGFSDLIVLDYGITWDPSKFEMASYSVLTEPGANTPTINLSMVSAGKFAYFWSDIDNTGESLPTGTALVEILFKVSNSATGTEVKVEDIPSFVTNDAYDFNFDQVLVIGNTLSMNLNAPVTSQLNLNYQILRTPNGCNDTLQIAVEVGQCFFELASVQFSLDWDQTKFMYLSHTTPYIPGGDVPIINTTEVLTNGRFGYGWGAISSITSSAPDNSQLLTLTFKTIGVGASGILAVNNPLLIEVIDQNYETINLSFSPSNLNVSTNNYYTIADGAYYNPATWQGGCVPDNPVLAGTIVNINHNLTLPVNDSITNNGTINSSLPFVNQGTYIGNGNFNGTFVNNGTVRPGDN